MRKKPKTFYRVEKRVVTRYEIWQHEPQKFGVIRIRQVARLWSAEDAEALCERLNARALKRAKAVSA